MSANDNASIHFSYLDMITKYRLTFRWSRYSYTVPSTRTLYGVWIRFMRHFHVPKHVWCVQKYNVVVSHRIQRRYQLILRHLQLDRMQLRVLVVQVTKRERLLTNLQLCEQLYGYFFYQISNYSL